MSYGKATPAPSQITSRILLGSNKHADALDASYSACLSVGSRTPRNRIDAIDYLFVPLQDNGPVAASDFSTCIEFVLAHLLNDEKKILIHCNAGRNRSAAIVTGLLILQGQFSGWDEAYASVKSKRECAGCNSKVKESVLDALANR
jgi:protein-tyrosine phosphatase